MNNNKTGILGENIALRYLLKAGYKILYRNCKVGFDEIDIIGLAFNGVLIFFEVKTLNNVAFGNYAFKPEDNFSPMKSRKIKRASQKFAAWYPGLLNEDNGWQIDLITVVLKGGGHFDLRHYKNV